MSKLSFRARALDASKPMPIYMAEEVPDLPEYSAINRAVPQMPSGMEKEEESEHHLQRAICAGLIIPTPEVQDMADQEAYDRIYPPTYKAPRQLIHMQPFTMEQDIPDYDMDSEDERWINAQSKKLELSPLKFEEMLDRLEKGSGQSVVTLQEAKSLLKEDDDLIIAVYDYWLEKRLKTQRPLIPTVKTELRLGAAANNPYLAFRRRTEKMQTRKNRKNDETSYEKMLKLRRDLSRAVTLLEMVKRREKTKREMLFLTVEIYEKRYQAGDFSGQLLSEVSTLKSYQQSRPAFAPIFPNQYSINPWANKVSIKDEVVPRKEKRQYKKRKHKAGSAVCGVGSNVAGRGGLDGYLAAQGSSEEETSSTGTGMRAASPMQPTSEVEDEDEGPFAFRRNPACNYHAPLPGGFGNWPWCSREEGGAGDRRYRYCLTSIHRPRPRCVGFARRRLGRGGRVILDREPTQLDDIWRSLDFTVLDSAKPTAAVSTTSCTSSGSTNQLLDEIKNEWLHFRPKISPSQDTAKSLVEEEANCLLDRHGPITLEVESMAQDDDPHPVSTVVELDLERLSQEDLFPSLSDLGDFSLLEAEPEPDSSVSLKEKDLSPSPSPVRTLVWDLGNGFGGDCISRTPKRPSTDLVSPYSEDATTLSASLSLPRIVERDLLKADKPRTDTTPSPSRSKSIKEGSAQNGPLREVESCSANGDGRPCSPPRVGCSAFFMCDSSSSSGGRISQTNGESLPAKSVVLTRPVLPPPYPSTSVNRQRMTGNGSSNHIDSSPKSSGSMVVVNHSDSVNSSSGGVRVHRPVSAPAAAPLVSLGNGPIPSAPSAEYSSGTASNIVGIRPRTSLTPSRRIGLIQQGRATSTTANTSAAPATSMLTQVAVPPVLAQNHTTGENTLNSEETTGDVCSDQKQLVSKNNALRMEVT